jgi:hypothetical protein
LPIHNASASAVTTLSPVATATNHRIRHSAPGNVSAKNRPTARTVRCGAPYTTLAARPTRPLSCATSAGSAK